jgi:serine/threonine protein kinase
VYIVTGLASCSLSDIIFKPSVEERGEWPALFPSDTGSLDSSGNQKQEDSHNSTTHEAHHLILSRVCSLDAGDAVMQPPKNHGKKKCALLHEAWSSRLERDELIRKIALQIIQAIVFIHGHQIIHRDVKPDNLLVLEKQQFWAVQLADFGMARFRTAEQNDLTTLIGSPHYVAPELMKGEKDYTNKADIYSFGMVVWALVHEQSPMSDAGVYSIVDKIVNRQERPTIAGSCSPSLRNLIAACW